MKVNLNKKENAGELISCKISLHYTDGYGSLAYIIYAHTMLHSVAE